MKGAHFRKRGENIMDGRSQGLKLPRKQISDKCQSMNLNRRLLVYGVAGLATLFFFVSIILFRRNDNISIAQPGSALSWPLLGYSVGAAVSVFIMFLGLAGLIIWAITRE